MQPRIELYAFPGAAMIVPCCSGVTYTNQADGVICEHPEIEGVLIPLYGLEDQLVPFFNDGPARSMDLETAAIIDALLDQHRYTRGVRVDRSRLAESMESWVHLLLPPPEAELRQRLYPGFAATNAVLTWKNSD